MFNNKRIKALEKEVAALRKELTEVTTMKVGDVKDFAKLSESSFFGLRLYEDGRPTCTAIEFIQMLMDRQKLQVSVVAETTTPQTISLVKA